MRCLVSRKQGENKTKMQMIVTFLAILELMKVGDIKISQEDIFEDIIIESLIAED